MGRHPVNSFQKKQISIQSLPSDKTSNELSALSISTQTRFCPHEEHEAYREFVKQCPKKLMQLRQVRKLQNTFAQMGQYLILFCLPVSIVVELSLFIYDGNWFPITFADLLPFGIYSADLILDQPWFIVFSFFAGLFWMLSGFFDYIAQELQEKLEL